MSYEALTTHVTNVLRSHKLLAHVVDWYCDSKSGSVTQGFIRGFILYYVPVTLLRRKLKLAILQRSVAVGGFSATVRAINIFLSEEKHEERLSTLLNKFGYSKESVSELRPAISGCVGIVLATLLDHSLVNSVFVLWCLMRGLPFILPRIPYGPTLAMCLAATQIGTTWVKRPLELDQSYRKFLISQGGKRASVLEMFGNEDIPVRMLCAINHPGQSCSGHAVRYCLQSFLRAVKLYAPLQLAFFIMSQNRSVKKSLIGLLKSSLFMVFYCASAWVILCINFKKPFVSDHSTISTKALYMRLWISGLGVLIENPSRRSELAQYCCTYAADSLYKHGLVRGMYTPNRAIGIAVLAFSWFLLMWNHRSQPKVLSKWLLEFKAKEIKEPEIHRDAEIQQI